MTAFEQLPRDDATRAAAADGLVRQLHEHLVANLRGDIAQRGQPLPPEGTSIPQLLAVATGCSPRRRIILTSLTFRRSSAFRRW